MCAQRNKWSLRFGFGIQTVYGTAVDTTYGIPTTNWPHLDPNMNVIDQRKATGLSYKRGDTGFEVQTTTQSPTFSFEMDFDKQSCSALLWSFFQKGGYQGAATVYPKYYIPYHDSEDEVWLTVVKDMGTGSVSHRAIGGLCSSLSFSATQGDVLKLTAEMMAKEIERDHDKTSDAFTYYGIAPFMWQNAKVYLNGNEIYSDGFTLNLTNGLISKNYNTSGINKFAVNDFMGDGTLNVPWSDTNEGGNDQLNSFIAGDVTALVIRWGDNNIATDDGDLSFSMNIRRTSTVVEGDDEIQSNVGFEIVSGSRSSSALTSSASTIAVDGSGNVTGTNTVFDSYNVGDLLYMMADSAADLAPRVITSITSDTVMDVYPVYSGALSGKNYFIQQTPCTISLGDSLNISGM